MTGFSPTSTGLLTLFEPWILDKDVSEILVNRPGQVYIEKAGEMRCHEVSRLTPRVLIQLSRLIANENAQVLNDQHPLLSASLQDGSRVQIVMPPVAKFLTLSIRRKVVKHFTLDDYQQTHFYTNARSFQFSNDDASVLSDDDRALLALYQQQQWDVFIRKAIEFKKTVVISGGTSSGKTTFLNACLMQIPQCERLIILEDTREIDVPHDNQVNLLAAKGEQGLAKVLMQDLVQCSLRLRPDRIIMGEIRGKEILDFISACSTGHEGSLTTIHANNPQIALMRMTQLYKLNNVPSMTDTDIQRELNAVIDVIVQINKTPQGRVVQSVYYKYGSQTT